MKTTLIKTLATVICTASLYATEFHPFTHLHNIDGPINKDSKNSKTNPIYNHPTTGDVNGDGRPDLVVGQYNSGKLLIYPMLENNKLGKPYPLKIDNKEIVIDSIC